MELTRVLRSPRFGEVAGLAILVAGGLLSVAMLTYHADDPSWWMERTGDPRNWIGPVGANISRAAFEILGFAAIVMPVTLVILGWFLLARRGVETSWERALGLLVVLVSFATLLSALFPTEMKFGGDTLPAGGLLGSSIADLGVSLIGRFGAVVGALAAVSLGLVLSTRFSFAAAAALAAVKTRPLLQATRVRWARIKESRRKEKMRLEMARKHEREQARRLEESGPVLTRSAADGGSGPPRNVPGRAVPMPPDAARSAEPEGSRRATSGNGSSNVSAGAGKAETGDGPARRGSGGGPALLPRRRKSPEQPSLPMSAGPQAASVYRIPPIELLDPSAAESPVNEKQLIDRARTITDKLREFSVDGQVEQIHPGPVVTTFEYKPEAGVKYSRIVSLVDDLCLAVKAESIRVDRIAGKSTVGIEIPNEFQEIIHLRDIVGSTAFAASRSRLTLGFGKTIDGEPYVTDLERMPHLLIAGSTGSGKSVGLNCMIASIAYKATPDQVRFILIDPKMLELGVYEDIPHLLIPVVTDMKKAATALKWTVREMESRYKTLATTGVRNIEQFNTLLEREPGRTKRNDKTGEEEVLVRLPYILIVIDELADLMMVASADVEESITRLAQMARAVGIHLIMATQRPSVDVITGVIKANFPARVAFRVSQRVDSRTILDTSGAEALLGHGDMLFLPPGSSRLLRVHGALITEPEVHRLVAFLKKQGQPRYNETILSEPQEEKEEFFAERDDMYDQAVRLVVGSGQASISHLQRRLRLGYARAARIVDMMEDEGIVGAGDGSKPREVLVGNEFLERMDQMAAEEGR